MRLADALGLPWEESFEEGSADHDSLYRNMREGFEEFLLAGGSVSLTDWCGFTMLERDAAATAGGGLRAINAASIGLSAQGYHSRILTAADGGDSLIQDKLESVLSQMERAKK